MAHYPLLRRHNRTSHIHVHRVQVFLPCDEGRALVSNRLYCVGFQHCRDNQDEAQCDGKEPLWITKKSCLILLDIYRRIGDVDLDFNEE